MLNSASHFTCVAKPAQAVCLLLTMLASIGVSAQQSNDVLLMDQQPVKSTKAETPLAERSPQAKIRLSPADQQKHQAWLASIKNKEADQIILQMKQTNTERYAKLTPAGKAILDNYQRHVHSDVQHGTATKGSQQLDEALARVYRHSQNSDGSANKLNSQQQAYLDYKQAKIREKFFDSAARLKNQRMLDDANAYLKMHLERQAEYARQFGTNDNPLMKNKAAPVSPERSKLNWLERQMLSQKAAELTPDPRILGAQNTAQVQAQIEDYLQQLRSSKSLSVSQRYGADARILSAAEAQVKMQENNSKVLPLPGSPKQAGALAKTTDKSGATVTTRSAIPGL